MQGRGLRVIRDIGVNAVHCEQQNHHLCNVKVNIISSSSFSCCEVGGVEEKKRRWGARGKMSK